MSHFTRIRIELKNLALLQEVLESQGHRVKMNAPVRGFAGNKTTADLVIVRPNGYDIGFCKRGDTVEMVADFWGTEVTAEAFLAPIRREYSRRQILATAAEKGFTVESETIDEKGEIKIVLGRWV